jgi:hypothetical protein
LWLKPQTAREQQCLVHPNHSPLMRQINSSRVYLALFPFRYLL